MAKPVLKWRAEYLQNGPFACLRDLFTGEDSELLGSGNLFGRLPKPLHNAYRHPMAQNSISRNHLVILSTFDMLDLRSLNGTTLNATPVSLGEPRQLKTGDLIVLANYVPFVFFGVEDEDRMDAIPQTARESWAMLSTDGRER